MKQKTIEKFGKDVELIHKPEKENQQDRENNAAKLENEKETERTKSEFTKFAETCENEFNEKVISFTKELHKMYAYKLTNFVAKEKTETKRNSILVADIPTFVYNLEKDICRVSENYTVIISEVAKFKKNENGTFEDNKKPESGIFAETDKSWFVKKESSFSVRDFFRSFQGARNYISKMKAIENAKQAENAKREKAVTLLKSLGFANPTEEQINTIIPNIK